MLRAPGAVDAIRELAADTNVGVANTCRLKGLFAWDDPRHLGTVGLQARDFELLGLAAAREVIAIGLDDNELDLARFSNVARVAPDDVAALDLGRQESIERPALYEALAAVVQPLYQSEKSPPSPARVLAELAASGEPVVAPPDSLTGFWVARAFPTARLGQVSFAGPPSIDWGPDDVDWSDTELLIAAAGEIVGWGS